MEREIISFDYAIKDILRDKANFDILSGFLSELLIKPVSVEEILESEGNTSNPDGKVNRLDLKAKIDDGEIVVIEIQFFDQIDFLGKILFNACKAVVEQVSSGELYKIKKVYSVNIAYFDMGAKDEYIFVANLTEFKGVHYNEVIPFSQNLDPLSKVPKDIHPEYFLILPRKYIETNEENKKASQSKFDEWVYVLKHSSVKSDFTAAGIQAAGEKLDVLKMTPKQRADYKRKKQMDMTQKSQLYTAELKGMEKGVEIGIEKGMEKGEKIGIEKGEKIGLEKGVEIGIEQDKEQMVIRGHKKGYSIEIISGFTDLSPDQILKILKQNGLA
jgi:predicted transposase/invertase (TIGR01784 family)